MPVKGFDKVRANLRALAENAPRALAAALYQEGLAVDAEAVKRTPVDTGRLRATHYVSPPIVSGDKVRVEIGFGTDYAVYVHERTDARHSSGEAKFLENALAARASGMAERIGKRVARNVANGIGIDALSGDVPTSPQDPGTEHSERVRAERVERNKRVREQRRTRKAARKADREHTKKMKKAFKKMAQRESRERKRQKRARSKARRRGK